jgi:hypothetical protein
LLKFIIAGWGQGEEGAGDSDLEEERGVDGREPSW